MKSGEQYFAGMMTTLRISSWQALSVQARLSWDIASLVSTELGTRACDQRWSAPQKPRSEEVLGNASRQWVGCSLYRTTLISAFTVCNRMWHTVLSTHPRRTCRVYRAKLPDMVCIWSCALQALCLCGVGCRGPLGQEKLESVTSKRSEKSTLRTVRVGPPAMTARSGVAYCRTPILAEIRESFCSEAAEACS